MAVTLHIYYKGAGGSARKFAEEMTAGGTVQRIREEPGNLQYEYFFPMDDSETLLLIDRWQDQHSIDLHHASPMMNTIAALREKYGLSMKAERYLSDEIPGDDRRFLRT